MRCQVAINRPRGLYLQVGLLMAFGGGALLFAVSVEMFAKALQVLTPSSHLISHLIPSHLIASDRISSHRIVSHLISSHLISPHPTSPHLTSSHLIAYCRSFTSRTGKR